MRVRRIAILIDGGFFIKKLKRLVGEENCDSAEKVAACATSLCKRHVQRLIHEPFHLRGRQTKWLDHVYRLYYYDALPFDGIAHHPISNQQIQFARSDEATFRHQLFHELRRRRKFALRLGKVVKEDDWHIRGTHVTKKLLRTRDRLSIFESAIEQASSGQAPAPISEEEAISLQRLVDLWKGLKPDDLRLGLRQKGVDMRIGIDITTLTLKGQVDTIVLVTGDSDFVPAAKVARREGVEFILDPMWQSVNDDLYEHVDGVCSGFSRPGGESEADDSEEASDGGQAE